MSNILGGKTESKAEIPEYAQQASKEAIALAKEVGGMDYMPYYGPSVAAITPAGRQAMQGTMDAAAAFGMAPKGMDVMAGMPTPRDFGGGMMGYSTGDIYDIARQELTSRHPQLAQAREGLFNTTYGDSPRYAEGGSSSGYGPNGVPPYGTPEFYEYIRRVTGGIRPA